MLYTCKEALYEIGGKYHNNLLQTGIRTDSKIVHTVSIDKLSLYKSNLIIIIFFLLQGGVKAILHYYNPIIIITTKIENPIYVLTLYV